MRCNFSILSPTSESNPDLRDQVGAVVPFLLWFTTLAGIAYVFGRLLLLIGHRLVNPVALAILIVTAAVLAAFGWRALSGGADEMRTVGAMTLRPMFWAALVWVARSARTQQG